MRMGEGDVQPCAARPDIPRFKIERCLSLLHRLKKCLDVSGHVRRVLGEKKFFKREEPDKLDKEYVRQFLAKKRFIGNGKIPEIPDDIKVEAARRYIKAYEMITGNKFKAEVGDVKERIRGNITGII